MATATNMLHDVREHMEVIGSDGHHLGTVDHVDGDRLKLTKNDSPDGLHHFLPMTMIDHVDEHVHLTCSVDEARRSWQAE